MKNKKLASRGNTARAAAIRQAEIIGELRREFLKNTFAVETAQRNPITYSASLDLLKNSHYDPAWQSIQIFFAGIKTFKSKNEAVKAFLKKVLSSKYKPAGEVLTELVCFEILFYEIGTGAVVPDAGQQGKIFNEASRAMILAARSSATSAFRGRRELDRTKKKAAAIRALEDKTSAEVKRIYCELGLTGDASDHFNATKIKKTWDKDSPHTDTIKDRMRRLGLSNKRK